MINWIVSQNIVEGNINEVIMIEINKWDFQEIKVVLLVQGGDYCISGLLFEI